MHTVARIDNVYAYDECDEGEYEDQDNGEGEPGSRLVHDEDLDSFGERAIDIVQIIVLPRRPLWQPVQNTIATELRCASNDKVFEECLQSFVRVFSQCRCVQQSFRVLIRKMPIGVRHEVDIETAVAVANVESLTCGVLDFALVGEPGVRFGELYSVWGGKELRCEKVTVADRVSRVSLQ